MHVLQRETEDSFMTNTKKNLTGLTHDEVAKRQQQYGKNELTPQKKNCQTLQNMI